MHGQSHLLHDKPGFELAVKHQESPAGCMLHLYTLPAGFLVIHKHFPIWAVCTANPLTLSEPAYDLSVQHIDKQRFAVQRLLQHAVSA